MSAIISTNGSLWHAAKEHLLRGPGENFGFFLAGLVRTRRTTRFALREYIPIAPGDLESDWNSPRDIKLEVLLDVINRAKKGSWAVIENHNHGGRGSGTTFSSIDRKGLREFSAYMLEALDGRPYGAIVWGDESIDAWWWRSSTRSESVDRVVVSDRLPQIVVPTSSRAAARLEDTEKEVGQRQILMFGEEGQRRVAQPVVAIVGLGGLGLHVAQQLAYLGVNRFVLVDGDKVAATNLNRCIGATRSDIGKPKVEIGARLVKTIRRHQKVGLVIVPQQLPHPEAIGALNDVDIIFGCLDNDGGRLVLNRLAKAYNLLYFDLAAGIDARDGAFTSAGGRVAVVSPDGPCLNCMGEIDRKEADYFLSSPSLQEQARKRGYASGWDLPNPSVVSLNGVISSMAVNEFMLGVTGLRPAETFTVFYLDSPPSSFQRATKRSILADPDCFTCSLRGMGDKAGVAGMASTF